MSLPFGQVLRLVQKRVAAHPHKYPVLAETYNNYQRLTKSLESTRSLLKDPDASIAELAQLEVESLEEEIQTLQDGSLERELGNTVEATTSKTDHLGALVELKSGVGGSESSLFVGTLLKMYTRFASSRAFSKSKAMEAKVVEQTELDTGGFRDVMLEIPSPGAYDLFRFESGIHRVQRVPSTDSSGRIHTSTAGVLVLPLYPDADASDKSKEELFKLSDVRIETMRASGAGGQHVNKTESAIRITHVPSGIVVACQQERSQHQNKRRAFTILASRLLHLKLEQEMLARKQTRESLVKSYDRSEKIRTYNFPQERVTDHRVPGLSVRGMASVIDGGNGLANIVQRLRDEWDKEQLRDAIAALEAEE